METEHAGTPDFAVLHVDGTLTYGRSSDDRTAYDALREQITDLSTQGMGRLRAYFSDTFTPDMAPNPLADRVLTAIGYHHPTGWYGTVALTMEESWTGECPPLTDEVRAMLDDQAHTSTSDGEH